MTRNPRQILTFGQGAHHCLGAAAARMLARVALEELLARIPDFAVDLDARRAGRRAPTSAARDRPARRCRAHDLAGR